MGHTGVSKAAGRTAAEQQLVNGHPITYDFRNIGQKILLVNARRLMQRNHQQQLTIVAIEDITDIKKED